VVEWNEKVGQMPGLFAVPCPRGHVQLNGG